MTPSACLLQRDALHMLYQYGYLMMADELCFWERELVQAEQRFLDWTRPHRAACSSVSEASATAQIPSR